MTDTLIRAAELLERDAEAIFATETVDGKWDHRPVSAAARADYDEILAVAKALRDSGMAAGPWVGMAGTSPRIFRAGRRTVGVIDAMAALGQPIVHFSDAGCVHCAALSVYGCSDSHRRQAWTRTSCTRRSRRPRRTSATPFRWRRSLSRSVARWLGYGQRSV